MIWLNTGQDGSTKVFHVRIYFELNHCGLYRVLVHFCTWLWPIILAVVALYVYMSFSHLFHIFLLCTKFYLNDCYVQQIESIVCPSFLHIFGLGTWILISVSFYYYYFIETMYCGRRSLFVVFDFVIFRVLSILYI